MRVAIVGLGYVGLPLAVELGRLHPTSGYDLKSELIEKYRNGIDPAKEIRRDQFEAADKLSFTDNLNDLHDHDIYIVAVSTPVDEARQPDLEPLKTASQVVARVMGGGSTVVYESTVFPGVTEEICMPILEEGSGLTWQRDFNIGYSPERINPGDKNHTLTKIVKVVAADNEVTLDKIAGLYGSIISAGIYRAPSIKVAEAAKVIENTQRDLNIAFVNELAVIFDMMGIDTKDVLTAAQTKWNFLKFMPGLVGGHCIGVDPYYLTSKAQTLGYQPEVILAGRRINDSMGSYIVEKTVHKMFARGMDNNSQVLVCGMTFKENCADLRNSQVVQVVDELKSYNLDVIVFDPVADKEQSMQYYDIKLVEWSSIPQVEAIVLAVPHSELIKDGVEVFMQKLKPNGVFIDVKSAFDVSSFNGASIDYWRL